MRHPSVMWRDVINLLSFSFCSMLSLRGGSLSRASSTMLKSPRITSGEGLFLSSSSIVSQKRAFSCWLLGAYMFVMVSALFRCHGMVVIKARPGTKL